MGDYIKGILYCSRPEKDPGKGDENKRDKYRKPPLYFMGTPVRFFGIYSENIFFGNLSETMDAAPHDISPICSVPEAADQKKSP